MTTSINDVTGSLGQMTVQDDALTELQVLQQSIRSLIQKAQESITHASQILSGVGRDDTQSAAGLKAIRRKARDVAKITQALNLASEKYVVARISSLCSRTSYVQRLFLHFEKELERVVRDVLDSSEDDLSAQWRIVEACYTQSVSASGVLHYKNYLIPLEEAELESPYDPDFESEEYYEHENRLQVDEAYAEAEHMRQEREHKKKNEREKQMHEDWVRFWIDALHKCPGGPTLFWPLASHEFERGLADVPRYLFRTFDSDSSGESNDTVVASIACAYMSADFSRNDILSLEPVEATERLYAHLNKSPFRGDDDDNLMSWSSSLLFVIQYAIWRYYRRNCSLADIKICVVDTAKFARGQFARDLHLIEACRDVAEKNPKMEAFVRFRKTAYDNGEFLSQGLVNHAGRSAVTTLGNLIQAGLYELYPELEDAAGRDKWTNRVRDIRLQWQAKRSTSSQEVQIAFHVAAVCFPQLRAMDVALLLLTFKNRNTQSAPTQGHAHYRCDGYELFGPAEVQRYVKAKVEIELRSPTKLGSLMSLFDSNLVQEFFDAKERT